MMLAVQVACTLRHHPNIKRTGKIPISIGASSARPAWRGPTAGPWSASPMRQHGRSLRTPARADVIASQTCPLPPHGLHCAVLWTRSAALARMSAQPTSQPIKTHIPDGLWCSASSSAAKRRVYWLRGRRVCRGASFLMATSLNLRAHVW